MGTGFYHDTNFATYDNRAIVNQSCNFSTQHLLNHRVHVSKARETMPLEVNLSISVDFKISTHIYTVLISDWKLAIIKPVEVMATLLILLHVLRHSHIKWKKTSFLLQYASLLQEWPLEISWNILVKIEKPRCNLTNFHYSFCQTITQNICNCP